ncbi:MAG: hypothetical protein L6R37_001411 [Teloschistes peruensis]|nr:MAG: hypothetical protein L6R37_001411 [Teloschistes peruensis]
MTKLRPVIPPPPIPLNARAAMKKGMLGAQPQPALASKNKKAASSMGPVGSRSAMTLATGHVLLHLYAQLNKGNASNSETMGTAATATWDQGIELLHGYGQQR